MDSKNKDRFNGQKLGLFIFESVMALFYVAFSIVLLFTDLLSRNIPKELRIGLGIILGIYGIFRVYRAYKKIAQKEE